MDRLRKFSSSVATKAAGIGIGGGSGEATGTPPEKDTKAAPVFVLSRETLSAHLQHLPEAFAAARAADAGPEAAPLAYLIQVVASPDGEIEQQYVINVDATTSAPLVWVVDHDDTPEDLRPTSFACTVRCDPASLLTLLAGKPAELRADSVPAMQAFLGSFRFDGAAYTSFCEARHLVAYVPLECTEPGGGWAKGVRMTVDARRSVAGLATGASARLHGLAEVAAPKLQAARTAAGAAAGAAAASASESTQSLRATLSSVRSGGQGAPEPPSRSAGADDEAGAVPIISMDELQQSDDGGATTAAASDVRSPMDGVRGDMMADEPLNADDSALAAAQQQQQQQQ